MCKHPMNNERDDNSRHEARINQYNRVISVDNRVIFHKTSILILKQNSTMNLLYERFKSLSYPEGCGYTVCIGGISVISRSAEVIARIKGSSMRIMETESNLLPYNGNPSELPISRMEVRQISAVS